MPVTARSPALNSTTFAAVPGISFCQTIAPAVASSLGADVRALGAEAAADAGAGLGLGGGDTAAVVGLDHGSEHEVVGALPVRASGGVQLGDEGRQGRACAGEVGAGRNDS